MRRIVYGLALAGLTVFAAVSVAYAGEEVIYSADGTTLKGYIAHPAGSGKHPGVLVVHEWWGNNDYPRKRTDMLAELGYVALAVDMYGDGKTVDNPKEAAAMSDEAFKNIEVSDKRFRAAEELLARQPDVDPGQIAAIGYGFGGGMVLEMARRGHDLAGVVSVHGILATKHPAKPGGVKAKVLVLNGTADPFTTHKQIEAFQKEMRAAGVIFAFYEYPGALHAFTNPAATENGKKFNLPLAYDAEADFRSWEATQGFLDAVFR